jgi:hypothetical protein
VFKGYLELSAAEMKDRATDVYFRSARESYTHQSVMTLITNKIDMLREATSIVARIAALSSLTNRRSLPILAIALTIPFVGQIFKFFPGGRTQNSTKYSIKFC